MSTDFYEVTTRASDLSRDIDRNSHALGAGQDRREPPINSIEANATVVVADVEKEAARVLRDDDGNPVFRQIWTDNGDGMAPEQIAPLLRNYNMSSKEGTVFAGNHGQGLILSNGSHNPYGMWIITKVVGQAPHLAIWMRNDDRYGLNAFTVVEVDDAGDEVGRYSTPVMEVTKGLQVDGVSVLNVWKSAFNNAKFTAPKSRKLANCLADDFHGTVVVECGEHVHDSTYLRGLRDLNTGNMSRWAMGEYWNSRFWEFTTAKLYWGVALEDFAFNMLDERPPINPPKGSKVKAQPAVESFSWWPNRAQPDGTFQVEFTGRHWEYRNAPGLRGVIYTKAVEPIEGQDKDANTGETQATIDMQPAAYPHCSLPFTVEVYMRELPANKKVTHLNFAARRNGRVMVDINGELYTELEANTLFAYFGITHPVLRQNVWIRIIPDSIGTGKPGSVWVEGGRRDLAWIDADGTSTPLPYREMGEAFRKAMPPKLATLIRSLDAADSNLDVANDKAMKRWWEQILGNLRVRKVKQKVDVEIPTTVTGPVGSVTTIDPGDTDGRRGPIVNPGETHDPGDGTTTRRPPQKQPAGKATVPGPTVIQQRTVTVTVKTPDKEPQPPHIRWIEDADEWPEPQRFGVVWSEPATANDMRGVVMLNWNHWYIQQKYAEMCDKGFLPGKVKDKMKRVFGKSVLTKVGHRRFECKAKDVGMTPDEIEVIFSPAALTGFLLGYWDHEQHLKDLIAVIGADDDEEDEDAA